MEAFLPFLQEETAYALFRSFAAVFLPEIFRGLIFIFKDGLDSGSVPFRSLLFLPVRIRRLYTLHKVKCPLRPSSLQKGQMS